MVSSTNSWRKIVFGEEVYSIALDRGYPKVLYFQIGRTIVICVL